MTPILFHAYHFPPTGGSGAQRPARLVRYLREFGYEPLVVTAPGPRQERWTPVDHALNAGVPAETRVWRVAGPEPASSSGWTHRAQRWLRVKDAWTRSWVERSTQLGIRVARENDVKLVYAWMQPYPSAEAAARIAAAVGKPWIADLGDPWALDEMMIYPTGLHRRLERRLMRNVLGTAAAIVVSTPEAERRVKAAFPELAERIVVAIPNGFDATDFAGSVPERADGAFRIVHTGYLHTELGERQRRTAALRRMFGGAVPGVDILARSPIHLIEAVERVRRERPDIAERLEVHFAGVLSAADLAAARKSAATRIVGFVSHDEARALVRTADLLFLPMHDLPPGSRATVVPGKTYEYVASGRPILAAVPDGDARDLLGAAGTAWLCRPTDSAAMAAAIVEAYDRSQAHVTPEPPPESLLRRYDYRALAGDLAAVFDEVA